jgi:protocatechuate 3,4-dioxygenase beta subunit
MTEGLIRRVARAFSLWEDGMPGTKLILRGYVLTTDCQPVANAWLDFWQADAQGIYDNAGYTLRGHQFTREDGSYELTTVVPGQYPGRTEHIHFKVRRAAGRTSQLYFPGAPGNETDRIFDPALVIKIVEEGSMVLAEFNIVIP